MLKATPAGGAVPSFSRTSAFTLSQSWFRLAKECIRLLCLLVSLCSCRVFGFSVCQSLHPHTYGLLSYTFQIRLWDYYH